MITEDDIALAGEYVLGLLGPADDATASARVAADAEFAAEVTAWRARLQPMLDGTEETPPAHIWTNISEAIAGNVPQDRTRGSLRLWQGLTALSAIAAAILAFLLVSQPTAPVPPPASTPLIAALGSETGKAALTASYDRDKGAMLVTPVSLDTGKLYPELWIIPADGKARSLGIVRGDQPTAMVVPAEMRQYLGEGATLAITPEPEGGAPGGKATGPVIASGKIVAI